MLFQARMSAAIEIVEDIARCHRPAAEALRDWGRAHRFAGSGDRSAIATLVYDVLRRRSSLAAHMGAGDPRALVLAAVRFIWGASRDWIEAAVQGPHRPGELTSGEQSALAQSLVENEHPWISGDYPEWLEASFRRAFGERATTQGKALAERAPIDLRANTIRADRGKVLKSLEKFGATVGPWSPCCIRIPAPSHEGRSHNVEAEPSHGKGWFEVQDAGSQVAALLAGAKPGEQVADICAGAGGKTLALAASMQNRGQIHAYDADRHRLRPIFERLQRAGARNVQVIGADEGERLSALAGKLDCVVVDAPCSGSGSWRRKPDAKWRLTEKQLAQRIADQEQVLDCGARLVRPGGRLVYITCSVLAEENDDRAHSFLAGYPDFLSVPYGEHWRSVLGTEPPSSAGPTGASLQLTPADHDTDGFFISIMRRRS